MRLAIIDLGTNSVRYDVHQIGPRKRVKRLHREKIMVRLGTGIFMNGKLDRGAIRRTLHAFKRFKQLSQHFRISKTIAFGTSALREASDRDRFLSTIEEQTGIRIRVISGSEEAKLIAHGILSGERRKHRFDRIKGNFALIDIGGGSTEISICKGKEILFSYSFLLGTARLQQLFLKRTPPNPIAVAQARSHIRSIVHEETLPNHWPTVEQVFGSSGTVRAVERILRTQSKLKERDSMNWREISDLTQQISRMSTAELLSVPGLESKRIDMIVPGALILDECMAAIGAKKVTFTEFSLRDGILEEELFLYHRGLSDSHLSLHFSELYEKAKLFGSQEDHLKRTVQVAEFLFDQLRTVHKLKPSWKVYLSAAMILRDIGESIHINRHPDHSYYIVKNSDLPAVEDWELELIAQLCLCHEGSKMNHADLVFTKNKTRREAFLKLLAILRVADALDSGPECQLKLKEVQVSKKKVILRYSGKGVTGLETANVEKKSDYFQNIFGRGIEAVRI
jgi:exopolyphosphatase/guanosine-5'-triphosphate,3'-diphosphate pyrophosphatase